MPYPHTGINKRSLATIERAILCMHIDDNLEVPVDPNARDWSELGNYLIAPPQSWSAHFFLWVCFVVGVGAALAGCPANTFTSPPFPAVLLVVLNHPR